MISLAFIFPTPGVYCQSLTAQELLPRQRAAKARALLQQVIVGLGGQAFQDVRDSDCSGQIAEFGHHGNVVIYAPFREMWLLPDRSRTEYSSKGRILITVFNGERGWVLDETGVSDQPDDAIKRSAEQVRFGIYNILRSYRSQEGLEFYYVGKDSIDRKAVEWIESSDHTNGELRLAVDESTHLPVQRVVSSKDPETDEYTENITSYSQFTPTDGVETPLSISQTQNGRLLSQIFITSCRYNSNLSPQLFTRASLEHHQREVPKGAK